MYVLLRRRPRTETHDVPSSRGRASDGSVTGPAGAVAGAVTSREEAERAFSVDATGQVSGDDGRHGHLAPAVHYACRMAAHLDATLGDGPLRRLRVDGPVRIDAQVRWGLGGECLVEATTRPGRHLPHVAAHTHPDARLAAGSDMAEAIWVVAQQGTRSAAHLDGAVRAVHDLAGARCTVLLDEFLDPLRLFGEILVGDLAVLSTRTQGVLRGLGEPDVTAMTLTFRSASVLVLPLTDGMLVLVLDETDTARVDDVLTRTRELMAPGGDQASTPAARTPRDPVEPTPPGALFTRPASLPASLPASMSGVPVSQAVASPGSPVATTLAGVLDQRASRAARRIWGRRS